MKKVFILMAFLMFKLDVFSQGCSDAGICTINTNEIDTNEIVSYKNSAELTYLLGIGLDKVFYNNIVLSYTRELNRKWGFNTKINYTTSNGDLGFTSGFGDFIVTCKYSEKINSLSAYKLTAGIKIPLNKSNFTFNNFPLPMEYQSSLGTFDALISGELKYKKIVFDGALQLPIYQINQNAFFSDSITSIKYANTNQFRRSSDLLVRATYNIQSKNQKIAVKPNVMLIYHTKNDSFQDASGNRTQIDNSKGITINANLISEFMFNKNKLLRLNLATPLIVRQIRPDGLTRSFVCSISFIYKF